MRAAVESIKSNPHFANPPVVAIIETAPGMAGPELNQYISDWPDVLTMSEWNAKGDVYGVPPHGPIRELQTNEMETRLSQGRIVYSEYLMTYPRSGGGQTIEKLKTELGIQLMGWERIVEMNPNKPLMKVKSGWSAKRSAGKDDGAVAAVMSWWTKVFWSAQRADRYGDFIRKYITPRMLSTGLRPARVIDVPMPDRRDQQQQAPKGPKRSHLALLNEGPAKRTRTEQIVDS